MHPFIYVKTKMIQNKVQLRGTSNLKLWKHIDNQKI